MSEERQEEGCCSSKKGCYCHAGAKFIAGLVLGALIFALGMWFSKAHF